MTRNSGTLSKKARILQLSSDLLRWTDRSLTHGGETAVDLKIIEGLRKLEAEGERDVVRDLVLLFFETASRRLELLSRALEAGDSRQLALEAHGLKSSSANLGARRLSQLASRLEELGETGSLAGAGELIAALKEEFGKVRLELSSQISTGKD